jgi:hypothetical protein
LVFDGHRRKNTPKIENGEKNKKGDPFPGKEVSKAGIPLCEGEQMGAGPDYYFHPP